MDGWVTCYIKVLLNSILVGNNDNQHLATNLAEFGGGGGGGGGGEKIF